MRLRLLLDAVVFRVGVAAGLALLWESVPAAKGSSVGSVATSRLTSDQAITSTAYTDVFSFALAANIRYEVYGRLWLNTSVAGIGLQLTSSASGASGAVLVHGNTSSPSNSGMGVMALSVGNTNFMNYVGDGVVRLEGFVTGTSTGVYTLQIKKAAGGGTVTVGKGSVLYLVDGSGMGSVVEYFYDYGSGVVSDVPPIATPTPTPTPTGSPTPTRTPADLSDVIDAVKQSNNVLFAVLGGGFVLVVVSGVVVSRRGR